MSRKRMRIIVRGAVQGVGFRPFVYRLATELGLDGWVVNSAQGVFIEIEGAPDCVSSFTRRLKTEKPIRAIIQSCESSHLDPLGYKKFEVRESTDHGEKSALILPDIATCDDCLREIFDPRDRRFRYPFTNCTNCGPRFSIIEALPYDRANTSMKKFEMCVDCAREYCNPADRRFHAEPTACPQCGPQLFLWNSLGKVLALADAALRQTADEIRAGKIVALKGIGGFQLLVDARNNKSVRRLRERKHREEKPFAVMFPSLEGVRECCQISEAEELLLTSPEAPIVLLQGSPSCLAPAVAPSNPNLGVMLPYSPLHHLLMRELNLAVVATSGNLSDEPICIDENEALERLRDLADLFLVHDRPVIRHVDDSIARVVSARELVLRRARGYAPLPVRVKGALPTILAVGAHLKNTVALSIAKNIFVSQHIGDLETEKAYVAFRNAVSDLPRLYEAKPDLVACDMHSDYLSTKFVLEIGEAGFQSVASGILPEASLSAEGSEQHAVNSEQAARAPRSIIRIQHHWAHVAACMAENELEAPALGVAWDGTGYGLDATVWGGEFLRTDNGSFTRVAHFRHFSLPGGDAVVKEPRRSAFGVLYEIFGAELWNQRQFIPDFSENEIGLLLQMLEKKINAPIPSSVGRLFDAVASLTGLRHRSSFEGQAAMELEFALRTNVQEAYPFDLQHGSPMIVDWEPTIRDIVSDLERQTPAGIISARFHNMLTETIVAVAKNTGELKVALSGGCFQNRYLTERTVDRLREENLRPYWHQRISPNDGGIALGQVVAAAWARRHESRSLAKDASRRRL